MDVKLLLERSTAQDLVDALHDEESTEVKSIESEKDLTEQAFGLAEAAAILAVARSAFGLASALWKFSKRRPETRSTIVIDTPLGNAKFELTQEMSVEDIERLIVPMFPTT
jgi:hypothetical protein